MTIRGKTIGNRWAIHPMEGWDGTPSGGVTDDMRRRWRRFGESGAKLIFGCEAMAVRPDGRANPNQLILQESNREGIRELASGRGDGQDKLAERAVDHLGRLPAGRVDHGGVHAGDVEILGQDKDEVGDRVDDQLVLAQLVLDRLGGPAALEVFGVEPLVEIGRAHV